MISSLQKASPSRLLAHSTTSPRPLRLAGVIVHSNKGFGKATQPKKKTEDDLPVEGGTSRQLKRAGRSKGKNQMRMGESGAAAQQQRSASLAPSTTTTTSQPSPESLTDAIEFEQRLKALKAEADRKKAEVASKNLSTSVLDGPPKYDDPPPLSKTLFMGGSQDAGKAALDKEYSDSSFGPSQLGLAGASLALVAVFLITSGGGDVPEARRPRSQSQQQVELAPGQKTDLQQQLGEVNAKLEANKDDLEALEAAAIIHARLGEFSVAADQLDVLTKAKPDNVDTWRVLAEVRAASGDISKSVVAYRKAWEASKETNLEVFTGLAGALVQDGKPQVAVDLVRAASSSASTTKEVGDVELGLLLAKTYSQWRGHAADAFTCYDKLIEEHPQDFRPPLGKALLLREQKREGDAQRYILQAKYLAPPASRPIVDALTATQNN